MKVIGILLIAIGIAIPVFLGFSFKQEKKVADIGPLEINKKENKMVGWPIYAGGFAMAAGVFILLSGSKRKVNG